MGRVGVGLWDLSLSAAVGAGTGPGTGTGGGGGPVLASLPQTPTSRWHPDFSTVTEAAGRVVSASDLTGLAGLSEGAPGIGPEVMTDAAGRRFWRFSGAEYLDIAGSLVTDTRDVSVFMVGRVPRLPSATLRFLSFGNRNQGTEANTLNGPLEARVVSNSAGHLQSFSKLAYSAASGAEHMVPGGQVQVMGAATSSSGIRLFLNERSVDVGAPFSVTGVIGGEIGRYAWSPGTSGSWGQFDLYEMVIYAPGLDPVTAGQVNQALMAAHGVAPVTDQIVLEGDSIMQGVFDVTPALSAGAVLTEPGLNRLPAGWRVTNKATSGARISTLVTRRDAANGWAEQALSGGRNILIFEIGRNDWSTETAASQYANVVAYLNTAGTGVLQRGWEVRIMANIATGSAYAAQTEAFRALIRDPQFLADCNAGPGQTYEGRVSVISTDLIEDQGARIFETTSQASNPVYYAGDNTHLSILGNELRMTGGDTPQHGVAWGV